MVSSSVQKSTKENKTTISYYFSLSPHWLVQQRDSLVEASPAESLHVDRVPSDETPTHSAVYQPAGWESGRIEDVDTTSTEVKGQTDQFLKSFILNCC